MTNEIPIKLTDVVERQAAEMLAIAWMNAIIEDNAKTLDETTHYVFDDMFKVYCQYLGWHNVKSIKITIEPEYFGEGK